MEEQTMKKRRTVHSISFKDEDLKIIKLAAQQEGISFASFLKHATLEYIKESLEYQRLVDSGQMSKEAKADSGDLAAFEETIKNTLLEMYKNFKGKLERIEWLAENSIYYQFYFNPATPEEEKRNKALLANQRMKTLADRIKDELRQERTVNNG
jgi:hypothetical protein